MLARWELAAVAGIKHRGQHKHIKFYINFMSLLKPFDSGLEKGMRNATHPWGGVDSSNPHHRRGWRMTLLRIFIKYEFIFWMNIR
jgi:hypothetical protein